ncbi:MAG: PEP-CTERM sorting domain-containing protein [Phycisphaeraceae bacterium]|nr:PEP-CTERM sorting domain-containing protein [Phycisphaerae bacterium]MBX3392562.1 PEP-CTERM sorting domain-containing protein [Phycisphaeraceae bacterium]
MESNRASTRTTPRGLAFAMLAVCLMASVARAAVVVYDNPNNLFFWEIGSISTDGSRSPGTFLDITRPASEQTGEQRPGTIGKWWRASYSSSGPAIRYLIGEPGMQTAKTTNPVTIDWNGHLFFSQHPTREYHPGESVSIADNWDIESIYFYHLPHTWDLTKGTPAISEAAYLGVRTQIAGRWHYGWILFTEYKWPAMWAYETTPDTPIEIPVPAPGALPLAALGLFAAGRRRPTRPA